MQGYARARGLRRLLLPVPVLTPRLSSYWVHWMTPIPAGIAVALFDGLRNNVVVTNDLARTLFPHIEPQDYASAIGSVMNDLDKGRTRLGAMPQARPRRLRNWSARSPAMG